MERANVLAKITASPTDNTWSQAYSTLNLYIVLSIRSEDEKEIANTGKELFEKIQREYFSLDEKNLKNIKTSISTAIGNFMEDKKISVTLATIQDNILYIVTAGASHAVIKRGAKIGTVAKGEENEIIAFSGRLVPNDIITIETADFTKKVSIDKLSEALNTNDLATVAESINPTIHAEPVGTEAALIFQYNNIEETENNTPSDKKPQEEESIKKQIEETTNEETDEKTNHRKISIPKIPINFSFLKTGGRKKIITVVIIALIIVLGTSIFLESNRQENARAEAALAEILTPAEQKFREAISLFTLNKGLALEEFQELKNTLEIARGNFSEGSNQLKKLDEFIGKVEEEIGKLTDGATINGQKVISENTVLTLYRNGRLFAVDDKGVISILNENGESEDEFETDNTNPKALTANDTSIYVLGDNGITRTAISNGNTTDAVEEAEDIISIDTFGSNIYGLNSDTNSIDRFSGASFTRGDYLNDAVELKNPASMAIDASIWVIDDGKIRKFTRGNEDSFTVSGLNLSNNSLIFTSVDYDNIYVVDKSAAKIYIISKNGDIENQYSWTDLSNTTSVSADEEKNTIYVTTGSKLYSFEFE